VARAAAAAGSVSVGPLCWLETSDPLPGAPEVARPSTGGSAYGAFVNSKVSGGLGCSQRSKSWFGLELSRVLFDKMSQRAGLLTKEHHACQGLVEVDADGVVLDLQEVDLDVRQACKM
jgi:hypothetical protein